VFYFFIARIIYQDSGDDHLALVKFIVSDTIHDDKEIFSTVHTINEMSTLKQITVIFMSESMTFLKFYKPLFNLLFSSKSENFENC
jgi:hypothetical protein